VLAQNPELRTPGARLKGVKNVRGKKIPLAEKARERKIVKPEKNL